MADLIQLRGSNAVVSSLDVAEHFEKKHKDILKKLKMLFQIQRAQICAFRNPFISRPKITNPIQCIT